MPHAKASCLVSQIRYSTVSWTNAVYRKPTYSLNTITLWCIILFSYHRRSLFCWKAQISKRSPGFHRVPERTLSRASICSDRTKTRTDHFHYGQFGNADHPTTRVFGLVEETGLPGGTLGARREDASSVHTRRRWDFHPTLELRGKCAKTNPLCPF